MGREVQCKAQGVMNLWIFYIVRAARVFISQDLGFILCYSQAWVWKFLLRNHSVVLFLFHGYMR